MRLSVVFLQTHEYHLGNGVITNSPVTAMEAFMKRDFEEILNFSEEPHDVIFVPDTFQYGPTGPLVLKLLTIFFHVLIKKIPDVHAVRITGLKDKTFFLPLIFSKAMTQILLCNVEI